MGTFVETKDRRKTVYLIRLDETFGDREITMNFTETVLAAKQSDDSRGYDGHGPATAIAIQQAIEYADYVGRHATPETLHEFNTRDYVFVSGDHRVEKNVRSKVSV